jgi:type I restriction enzyme M protein
MVRTRQIARYEAVAADAVAPQAAKARARSANASAAKQKGGDLGFEAKLWQAADLLRSNLDAAEYKHVVLGLLFLKYISDAFVERQGELALEAADPASDLYVHEPSERYQVTEDRDAYAADLVFWVPTEARWSHIQHRAKDPTIGSIIDAAMDAVERENPRLRGVLRKDYARPGLAGVDLGRLIDLLSGIGLGDKASRSTDVLGRVYEYFLGQFASAEGKKGGEFYTPRSIVRLLVEMLAPHANARVYDPCCGSGGMFVQSESFLEAHGGRRGDIAIYGQESNPTTWQLSEMNLAIRGIEADIALGDTLHADKHPDLRADYVLANPPFNVSDWGGEKLRNDKRWKYGVPPVGNANFAWVQHFIYHLAPQGTAGFVLANGSMSSNQSGEGDIRRAIVEADLVDCIVALPPQLFYSTQIPACLWFLTRSKRTSGMRDRRGETLFVDARKLGSLIDRTHRELSADDIARVSDVYHAWRSGSSLDPPVNVPGFAASATEQEIAAHSYVLTPGRYVDAEDIEDDDEPFEDKIARLTEDLQKQFQESQFLSLSITNALAGFRSNA